MAVCYQWKMLRWAQWGPGWSMQALNWHTQLGPSNTIATRSSITYQQMPLGYMQMQPTWHGNPPLATIVVAIRLQILQ
jgi:hypothetical protein